MNCTVFVWITNQRRSWLDCNDYNQQSQTVEKTHDYNGLLTKQATIPDHLPHLCMWLIFAKSLTTWLSSEVVIGQKHNVSDEGNGLAKWFLSDVWLRNYCRGILRESPLYNHGRRTYAYWTQGHMVYRNLTLCIYKCMDLGFS